MKKIILLLFVLVSSTFAGGGWATSAISVSLNGGSAYNYVLNNEGWTDGSWGSNDAFDSKDFGTVSALVINGASGNAWTDDIPGYTSSSFKLYYRVYLSSGSGGAWTELSLDILAYSSGSNKIYDKTGAVINILGLVSSEPGTYTLEVVMSKNQFYDGGNWNSMVPGGQAVAYNSATAGYKATFTIAPLPVELTSFTSKTTKAGVMLNWTTATEVNNFGFDVETLNATSSIWEKVGFVEGHGNSNSPKEYSFFDNSGATSYRLKQVDFNGNYEYSDVVTVKASLAKTELYQNSPNPFNPSTKISFSLAETGKVNVSIYNIIGQKVADLVNQTMESGVHSVDFNASNLPSGLYIYRLDTPNYSKTMKMMLIK